VIYLLHFSEPYPAGTRPQHYIGYCSDDRELIDRLAEHSQGRGARLLAVIREKGITFELARTWEGSRNRERQIKRQGGGGKSKCPMCGVVPRNTRPGKAKP
jgi:predicted GIY-YIG superfamily endonuclease